MKTEISNCAENSKAEFLNDEILLSEEIELFSNQVQKGQYYIDVPLKNIVGLEERKAFENCSNWREAAKNLDCNGWDKARDKIVDYFNSELKNNIFPMPGSDKPMTLFITGSAAYCQIGNHRLVAAMVWNTYNLGETTFLKKVKCVHQEVNSSLQSILNACAEGCGELYFYRKSTYVSYVLFKTNSFWELYKQDRSDLKIHDSDIYQYFKISKGRFQWMMNLCVMFQTDHPFSCYKKLPRRLCRLLIDDSLLKQSVPC
ncbi:hypothetical protein [Aeromonas veronii]|uniref:hypothetical protein n=1 Tax=Aeromonas veronii TaxID=654 RepID=UPI003D1D0AD2